MGGFFLVGSCQMLGVDNCWFAEVSAFSKVRFDSSAFVFILYCSSIQWHRLIHISARSFFCTFRKVKTMSKRLCQMLTNDRKSKKKNTVFGSVVSLAYVP